MASEVSPLWEIEEIPDADRVYMRVHRKECNKGIPELHAFRYREKGMSVNWNKYSSAERTREEVRNFRTQPKDPGQPAEPKKPEDYAVISFIVGDIRRIPGQTVVHDPDIENYNRAHSNIWSVKPLDRITVTDIRRAFAGKYRMELELPRDSAQ